MKNNAPTIAVVMCGGGGSRLWPRSRTLLPKPFLELPKANSESPSRTLLGETYARLAEANLDAVVTVAAADSAFLCGEFFRDGKANCPHFILAEPAAKNTAPAVAVAAEFIGKKFGDDAILLALPADHIIADSEKFWRCIGNAKIAAEKDYLALLGIKPDRPAVGYGYLALGEKINEDVFRIARFIEKPDIKRAEEYVKKGFFWNAGIFCFSARAIKKALAEFAPDIAENTKGIFADCGVNSPPSIINLNSDAYPRFPSISLDFAVMEKTQNAAVALASGIGWSDLGSWRAFAELLPADSDGNRAEYKAEFINSKNCAIMGDGGGGRFAAVIGMENICVADSKDALLICAMDSCEQAKEVFDKLRAQNHPAAAIPEKVRRPWGYYSVLAEGGGWKVKRIVVLPGAKLSLQSHSHRSEHWTTVEGVMTVVVGDKTFEMAKDESCRIPLGEKHRMMNNTDSDAAVIEVQVGDYLGEDDITRYEDIYGRI